MDKRVILWSIALFFGCSILFAAIDRAVDGTGLSLAIQAAVLVVIVVALVAFTRRRS